ncbi:CLK4-associating serine/arginine rich protein isoform X2 [Leptidea sinapis]|nr:CLK4-associating serine/arginine rich protein isoform X2 [Leptidea sinapis]
MKLEEDSDDESEFEIIDVDLSIDVNKMEASQAHALNAVGPQFGMAGCDLFSFLTGDADDAEHQKQMLREEKEKALFSGRKSRRERRAHRDKRLPTLPTSPPSYAAKPEARDCSDHSPTHSHSKSPSPEPENIEFITSFGPEDEEKRVAESKPSYSEKLKRNLRKSYAEIAQKPYPRPRSQDSREAPQIGPRRRESRSRSRSKSISRSRSSRSKSYSRSRSRSSRSRSRSPYRSRSRSRSRNYRRRSRSSSNAGGYSRRNRSRSQSYESKPKSSEKAVPRYYGRRKEDKSSSDVSLDSDESDSEKFVSAVSNKSKSNQNHLRFTGSSSKGLSREPISMKERLRRKMQAQLSKQLKADKRAEAERQERESRRQARRDEEMRELAIKLRRKQREMRHQQRLSSDEDSDKSRSGSSERNASPRPEKRCEERSRSRSRTPERRIVQVWETDESSPYRQKYQEIDPAMHKRRFQDNDDHSKDDQKYRREQNRPEWRDRRGNLDGPSRRTDEDTEDSRKIKLVDY